MRRSRQGGKKPAKSPKSKKSKTVKESQVYRALEKELKKKEYQIKLLEELLTKFLV